MRQTVIILILVLLVGLCSCAHHESKSRKCFDDIREMVKGKTAAEVQSLLGKPDSRQKMLLAAERWIWWNYTYLDGNNYSPEMRGRKVHLEIIFERIGKATGSSEPVLSELRAVDPLSVSYTLAKDRVSFAPEEP